MLGTRFEFDGTGIFHATDLLDECNLSHSDEGDYRYAEKEFDKTLEIPEIISNQNNTISFFKQEGLEAFNTELDILVNLFINYPEEAGLGILEEIKLDIPESIIIYQDEYQALILEKDYIKLKEEQNDR